MTRMHAELIHASFVDETNCANYQSNKPINVVHYVRQPLILLTMAIAFAICSTINKPLMHATRYTELTV